MKKTSIILSFAVCLLSFETSLAYTSTDVSNALFLATEGIIVTQSSASGYRLDATITRAEAIGIALKIKGVTLPNNYTCKNYFIDAPYNPSNNWICRAVELAKDNGIVSGENIKARPADPITRSEVLAMTMHAALNNTLSIVPKGYKFSTDTVEWQQNIFYAAEDLIMVTGTKYDYSTRPISVNYFPNRNATRAEVFSFAKNILSRSTQGQFDVIQFPANAVWEHLPEDNFDKLSFGKMVTVEGYQGEALLRHECTLYVAPSDISGGPFSPYYSIDRIEYMNSIPYFTATLEIGLSETVILGNKYTYTLTDHTAANNCLESLKFNNLKIITQKFVLENYYSFINRENYGGAFLLRSPAGVSEETFAGWYKNVTSVVFQEDTLKDLGNNTYEFLVNMVENGVKTTYKIKSKVDLENFKINNISSVKQ